MTVKEVKERLNELNDLHDNAIRIQNCCLGNENAWECIKKLEKESGIKETDLRTFATLVAGYASDEIKRLNRIIDNASVKID